MTNYQELTQLTALELGARIRDKQVCVSEAVEASLTAIQELDPALHAFLTVDAEGARKKAMQIQSRIDAGELIGPLAGVPIAVKDNICTKGLRTTCGSRMLEHYIPPYSAQVVENLEAAGMIVIGKTNLDEFAMGSTTETSYFGATNHPTQEGYVSGGSSGGSACAVRAQMVPLALGSDTGGSIRQPGSHCGVVGMKPSYGMVSRRGLVAYGSSLDQIGPIGRNVADCTALLQVLASYDPLDATSVSGPAIDAEAVQNTDLRGVRIGLPVEYFGEGLQPEIRDRIYAASLRLREAGAVVEECSIAYRDDAVRTYYLLACAEASSNLERFDGVKYGHRAAAYQNLEELYRNSRSEGFGSEVKRRLMLGSFVLSSGYYDAYYRKALRAKQLIRRSFDDLFANYDLILAPVAPTTAPKRGEAEKDPMEMYLADVYTVSANLCGLPAISIPVGCDSKGLPIGMQIIGNRFRDAEVLHAAYACEHVLASR